MTRNRRGGSITIDVCEFISEIADGVLIDEMRERGLSTTETGETCDIDIVREAFVELSCGRSAEALAILDRLLNPKWRSTETCAAHYKLEQGELV